MFEYFTKVCLDILQKCVFFQSLLSGGESGAGITETANIAMQYSAALGGGSGIEYY